MIEEEAKYGNPSNEVPWKRYRHCQFEWINSARQTKQNLEDQIRFDQDIFESQFRKAKDELTKLSEGNAYTTNLLGYKISIFRLLCNKLIHSKDRMTDVVASSTAST